MDPTDALRAIESALRLVIREVLGDQGWLLVPGAPDEDRLRDKQVEEDKRRNGTAVSTNLLDYAETYHLTEIVMKNWERFQPIFKDRARCRAYFEIINDVRNSIAHSRDLVPFERDLISGVAGQLRNQVSLFRSDVTQSAKYYPLIESIRDSFGFEAKNVGMPEPSGLRLEVGDRLTFNGTAFNARGKAVRWQMLCGDVAAHDEPALVLNAAEGESVTFDYAVLESDIGEWFRIRIRIVAEGSYHRFVPRHMGLPFDDERTFIYAVNPPWD